MVGMRHWSDLSYSARIAGKSTVDSGKRGWQSHDYIGTNYFLFENMMNILKWADEFLEKYLM